MKKTGIYLITTPNGGKYVGSSVDIDRRWARHKHEMRNGVHRNPILQRAFDKHGEALQIEVLELCDRDQLLIREQSYIDTFGFAKLYNLQPYAGGGFVPGLPRPPVSAETREKMRAAHLGRRHSTETRHKMSANLVGHKHSALTKQRIGAKSKGRKHTDAVKLRNVLAQTGKPLNVAVGSSGYKGVTKGDRGWRVRVLRPQGGLRNIGTYRTPELAYATRLAWLAVEGWGL